MCKISRPGLYKDGQGGVVLPGDIAQSDHSVSEGAIQNSNHNTAAEFGTVVSCDLWRLTTTFSSSQELLVEV
jgi:hypothetical protein